MNTLTAVQSFLNNRNALNRSDETLKWYRGKLMKFAAACPELPMYPEPLEEFLATAVPGQHYEIRHGYYRSLKALYRFTCRRKRLPNPMDLIEPPTTRKKVRPTLNSDDMLKILSLAVSLRDKAILNLYIDSGPRADEVASLRRQNIFPDCIKVDGKTGEREIPISEETRRLLLDLVASNGNCEYVFQGQRGTLTRSGMYNIVRGCMLKAGISGPKLGPHRIRHAFGRNYVANGGDIRSLQQIMGHTNIGTTEIYVELSREEICAKHHQFTPLRSVHAAAQRSLFDKSTVLKEVEEIIESHQLTGKK